jgi:hypothetical protein
MSFALEGTGKLLEEYFSREIIEFREAGFSCGKLLFWKKRRKAIS